MQQRLFCIQIFNTLGQIPTEKDIWIWFQTVELQSIKMLNIISIYRFLMQKGTSSKIKPGIHFYNEKPYQTRLYPGLYDYIPVSNMDSRG